MIKRNILVGLCGQGALFVLSLVSTHLIFHRLGAGVLGVISFAVTLTYLLIILADMGVSMLITREVAAHRKTDSQYVRELYGSFSVLAWILFGVASILVTVTAPFIVEGWLNLEGLDRETIVTALPLISVSLLVAIPRAVYGSVMSGYERVDLWNGATVLVTAIQQGGMILVLALGGDLIYVSVWYLVSALVSVAVFIAVVTSISGLPPYPDIFRWGAIRRNLAFGSSLLANSLAGYFVTQIDRWAVSKYLPVSSLGFYGFYQSLVSKGAMVPNVIANAAFPALSASVSDPDKRSIGRRYAKLHDLNCYSYAPIAVAAAMLGVVVTQFVFDRVVAEAAWQPLCLLAFGQYLLGTLYVPFWFSVAQKKVGISLKSNILALPIVVPVTVYLTYTYGLLGAATGPLVYGVWQYLYFIPRFTNVCLGVSPKAWYRKSLLFVFLLLLAYGGAWLIAWSLGAALSLTGLVGAYLAGTAVFLACGWHVLGSETQTEFRRTMMSLFASVGIVYTGKK